MSIKALLTRILEALKVDYVVGEGTSGIWTYRKWNSGIAECWGQSGNISKAFSTSLGSGYYAPKYTASYPSGLFNGTPVVEVTMYDGGAVLGWASVSTNNPTTVEVYPVSLINVTRNVQLHFNAKGRWK